MRQGEVRQRKVPVLPHTVTPFAEGADVGAVLVEQDGQREERTSLLPQRKPCLRYLKLCIYFLLLLWVLIVVALIVSFFVLPSPLVYEPSTYGFEAPMNISALLTQEQEAEYKVQKLYTDKLCGVNSVVMEEGKIFASLTNGRIVRLERNRIFVVATVGDKACEDGEDSGCGHAAIIRFHPQDSRLLVVADNDYGIMTIDKWTGKKTVLILPRDIPDGVTHINGMDISRNGQIFFTDSSSRWSRRDFVYSLLADRDDGRLIKYDPQAQKVSVLLTGLHFPTGVKVKNDQTAVLICETLQKKVVTYSLSEHIVGTATSFSLNLPGLPISVSENSDKVWVSMILPHHLGGWSAVQFLGERPRWRYHIAKFVDEMVFQYFLKLSTYPMLTEMDAFGNVVRVLHHPSLDFHPFVPNIYSYAGFLYMPSPYQCFIPRINLNTK